MFFSQLWNFIGTDHQEENRRCRPFLEDVHLHPSSDLEKLFSLIFAVIRSQKTHFLHAKSVLYLLCAVDGINQRKEIGIFSYFDLNLLTILLYLEVSIDLGDRQPSIEQIDHNYLNFDPEKST